MERREFLKGVLRWSPLLIPGVAEIVFVGACRDNTDGNIDISKPTKTAESLGMERKVITYPDTAQPSAEIAREIFSFQKEKTPIILFRLDPKLTDVISKHVKKIVNAGYANAIDDKDFFHGHFHINDPKSCHYTVQEPEGTSPWGTYGRRPEDNFPPGMTYKDWIEKFLSADPYFVYHTREYLTGQDPVVDSQGRVTPPETDYTGPPRSIIGTMSDEVYPMTNDQPSYKKYGSISGMDTFEYNGKKSEGMCETQPFDTRIPVDGHGYRGSQTFYIIPDTNGRYLLDNGMKFDVYLQLH